MAAVFSPALAQAQSPFFTLTGVADGNTSSRLYGLSADGASAAGYSLGSTVINPGFRWTQLGGRYDFGLEPDLPSASFSSAISGDGTTVTGVGGAPNQAFRWSGPGTFQSLGVQAGYARSYGQGVSGNGSVVVGRSETGTTTIAAQAFRWTQATGIQGLGFTRPGHGYSEAAAISRDGGTIVGRSTSLGTGFTDAFVWTRDSGMQMLPPPAGGSADVLIARSVNADGTIVVGNAASPPSAVLWRNGTAMALGIPAGWGSSSAFSVSDDGNVVACTLFAGVSGSDAAGVWTSQRGIEPLTEYLSSNGVLVPNGWTLQQCTAVSGDGSVFGGWARADSGQTQGFIARVPEPGALSLCLAMIGGAAFRPRRPLGG